jgi:hypothetical protein
MRIGPRLVFAGLVALATSVHAEPPDCATFPNDRARFACYDAISRAPKPEPTETVKARAHAVDSEKPKPAIARARKTTRGDQSPRAD